MEDVTDDAPSSTVERTWSKGREGRAGSPSSSSSTPAFPLFTPNIVYLFVHSFSYLVWTPLPAFLALLSSSSCPSTHRSWVVLAKIFCSDGIAGWAKASGCAVPLAALPRRWGRAGAHSEQRHSGGVSCWWAPLSSFFFSWDGIGSLAAQDCVCGLCLALARLFFFLLLNVDCFWWAMLLFFSTTLAILLGGAMTLSSRHSLSFFALSNRKMDWDF